MIHDSVASEASRLVRIVGRATLTMVVSSRAMNMPASSTTSACQERRGTAREGAPPAAAAPVRAGLIWSVMAGVLGVRSGGGGERVGRQCPGPLVGDDGGEVRDERGVPVDLGPQ